MATLVSPLFVHSIIRNHLISFDASSTIEIGAQPTFLRDVCQQPSYLHPSRCLQLIKTFNELGFSCGICTINELLQNLLTLNLWRCTELMFHIWSEVFIEEPMHRIWKYIVHACYHAMMPIRYDGEISCSTIATLRYFRIYFLSFFSLPMANATWPSPTKMT